MSSKPAVKLMIQSGMVPKNAVEQLINWKLLPPTFSSLHGDSQVSSESEWETVEDFVKSLNLSLTEEMGTIRETELDRSGGFQLATLVEAPEGVARVEHVFVDKLGRVIFPVSKKFADVETVSLSQGPFLDIVRREPRYDGDRQVAWVCYLEGKGGSDGD